MKPCAKSQNAEKRHDSVPGTFQTISIFPDMVKKLVDGQKSNHVSRLYQFCWNKYVSHRGQSGYEVEFYTPAELSVCLRFILYRVELYHKKSFDNIFMSS